MRILVVGGAGYIGSHMVKLLLEHGHAPVTLDSLVTGYRDAVPGGELVVADLADRTRLKTLFQEFRFDAVMHFASFIQVGESVRDPRKYYANNLVNTINLLDTMAEAKVEKFVFSSTAAVYGEPAYVPIDEAHPLQPINPYGASKWMVERILEDYDRAYGLRSVRFRYFNAAGAHPSATLGERHEPETHLIPLVLQVAAGRRTHIQVFGRDYATHDGTCIRDYIHVCDLCDAHLRALDFLERGQPSAIFNLGNGNGFSVLEVIQSVRRVTGREVSIVDAPRRDGDPARLVAVSALAREKLGWTPQYTDLDAMVGHAWAWERKLAG